MATVTDDGKPSADRTMPVWIAVGVAAVLVGLAVDAGPARTALWLGGVLAIAYGIGQYLRQTRR